MVGSIYTVGTTTWESRESFIDPDGTMTDIFQDYEKIHPTPTGRPSNNKWKRSSNTPAKKTRKTSKTQTASTKNS